MMFLQGDCLNILPTFASECVNFVLTDPPYLARYVDRKGRSLANDDNDTWLKPAFEQIYRVLARDSYCVSFYGWPKLDRFVDAWRSAGFRIVGHLVFPKDYTSNKDGHLGYSHECAYLLAKGSPRPHLSIRDVLPWSNTGNRWHPTEKPLCALIQIILAFSLPGHLILDPFAGSASTLIAARRLGRDYIGIELDPVHYASASRRLAEE